jgi:phage I-like protein
MRKIQLMITPELMAQLGLTDSTDDASIVMAIKKTSEQAAKVPQLQSAIDTLKTENTTLKTEKETLENKYSDKEVENILEKALSEGRTTVELNNQFKKDYKGKPEALQAIVNGLKPFQSLVKGLAAENKNANKYEGKTYDELHNSGELGDVRANHPEIYKNVFQDKFGKEPKS